VDPLEARHLIPLAEHFIHMNHAGVSPMSRRVSAAIEQVVEASVNRPYRDHWAQDEADRLRGLLGQLINAPPESIALTRSTSHGMSLLAAGLDWHAGENVVGAVGEYPSNVYPWMALSKRGVELRQARPVEGRVTAESVLALVDSRTRLVALSHVEFWNGYRVAIETIGAECRRRGVIFAVDVMQSAGVLRIDPGFYVPVLRTGAKMNLRMNCLGHHWSAITYQYTKVRDIDGREVAPVPDFLQALAQRAVRETDYWHGPGVVPDYDICIVNLYDEAVGKLGVHADVGRLHGVAGAVELLLAHATQLLREGPL